MPTTAPSSRNHTLHQYLYLKNKLMYRKPANFFSISPEELAHFNALRSVVEPTLPTKETATHA